MSPPSTPRTLFFYCWNMFLKKMAKLLMANAKASPLVVMTKQTHTYTRAYPIYKKWTKKENNNQQWRTTYRLSSLKPSHVTSQTSTCRQKNAFLKSQEKCESKKKMCMTQAVSSTVQCTKARRTEAFCWSYTQPGGRYSFGASALLAPKEEAAEKAVPAGLTTSSKAVACIDGAATPMLAILFQLERIGFASCIMRGQSQLAYCGVTLLCFWPAQNFCAEVFVPQNLWNLRNRLCRRYRYLNGQRWANTPGGSLNQTPRHRSWPQLNPE